MTSTDEASTMRERNTMKYQRRKTRLKTQEKLHAKFFLFLLAQTIRRNPPGVDDGLRRASAWAIEAQAVKRLVRHPQCSMFGSFPTMSAGMEIHPLAWQCLLDGAEKGGRPIVRVHGVLNDASDIKGDGSQYELSTSAAHLVGQLRFGLIHTHQAIQTVGLQRRAQRLRHVYALFGQVGQGLLSCTTGCSTWQSHPQQDDAVRFLTDECFQSGDNIRQSEIKDKHSQFRMLGAFVVNRHDFKACFMACP